MPFKAKEEEEPPAMYNFPFWRKTLNVNSPKIWSTLPAKMQIWTLAQIHPSRVLVIIVMSCQSLISASLFPPLLSYSDLTQYYLIMRRRNFLYIWLCNGLANAFPLSPSRLTLRPVGLLCLLAYLSNCHGLMRMCVLSIIPEGVAFRCDVAMQKTC